MMFGHHAHLTGKTEYITFLRKPIDRAISYYNHVLRVSNHRLNQVVIKNKWSFDDFVLHSDESDIFNLQVRLMSGIHDSPAFMLEKAIENIEKHFSFIGFQEQFDESLIILKNIYEWDVPYYKKLNIGLNENNVELMNERAIKIFNQLNKEDLILYDYCKKRFNNQLEQIPNLKFELARLKIYSKLYSSTKIKKLNQKLFKLKK